MTWLVLLPLVVLLVAVSVGASSLRWIAASAAALEGELLVLHQLGAARDLLVADLARTQDSLGRTIDPMGRTTAPADAWRRGAGR